jgi:hypothetical protein
MGQTLTISDSLYAQLKDAARQRGLDSVEQLLQAWQAAEEERSARRLIIERIDKVRERMAAAYGEMPDSADLIVEDRQRP